MGFVSLNVFGGGLWRGQPRGHARLSDVVLLLAAQKRAEVHRELLGAPVMTGDGLGTNFMGNTVDFDCAEDLRGIEQGVEHPRMMKTPCPLAR